MNRTCPVLAVLRQDTNRSAADRSGVTRVQGGDWSTDRRSCRAATTPDQRSQPQPPEFLCTSAADRQAVPVDHLRFEVSAKVTLERADMIEVHDPRAMNA